MLTAPATGNLLGSRPHSTDIALDITRHVEWEWASVCTSICIGPSVLILTRLNISEPMATTWKYMSFDSTLGFPGEGPVCSRCLGDRDSLCACDRPNRTASSQAGPYGRGAASSAYNHLDDWPASVQVRNTFVEVSDPTSSRRLRPTVSEPAGGSSVANAAATDGEGRSIQANAGSTPVDDITASLHEASLINTARPSAAPPESTALWKAVSRQFP